MEKTCLRQKIFCVFFVFCLLGSFPFTFAATDQNMDEPKQFWMTLAANAWNYYQPGVGVNPQTGIVLGQIGYPFITDWDLGLYLQAILNAEKLGLISSDESWNADFRIEKVLTFLETRPLMPDGLPFLSYASNTGKNIDDTQQVATDAGNLFAALKNLEDAKPHLKERVDNIVYNHTNYEPRCASVDILLGQIQSGKRPVEIYDYYTAHAFAGFWPQRFSAEADEILNIIVNSPTINYSGIILPEAKLTSEPLLLSILNSNQPDERIVNLTKQVYLAQEARFNLTGKYTAFSEGPSSTVFVWEWVTMPDGRMFVIQTGDSNDVNVELKMLPIVYLKTAVGYLAVYNSAYTQNMVSYLFSRLPALSFGYAVGANEEGSALSNVDCLGNSLILSAARYAVDHKVEVPLKYPVSTPSMATDSGGKTNSNIQSSPSAATPTPSPKLLNTYNFSNVGNTTQSEPESKQKTSPDIAVTWNDTVVAVASTAVVVTIIYVAYRILKKY